MLLPSTSQSALLLLLLAFVCLGSWANFFKASRWRYEFFYLDFALGAILFAVVAAYTLGTMGTEMSFQDRMVVAGLRSESFALAAGVVFGLGNLLLLAGVALGGMAIAFPFALSIALLIATAVSAGTHSTLGAGAAIAMYLVSFLAMLAAAVRREPVQVVQASRKRKAEAATPLPVKLISVCLLAGILLGASLALGDVGFFGELGLGPYAGTLLFTAGLVVSTVLFDVFFMNIGIVGGRITLPSYKKASGKQHSLAVLGGCVWAGGFLSAFLAHSAPLPAWSAWLAQGWALLAGAWGCFVWKELPRRTVLPVMIGSLAFAGAIAVRFLLRG